MQREKLTCDGVTAKTEAYYMGSFRAVMSSQLSQIKARGWILDVHKSQSLASNHLLGGNISSDDVVPCCQGQRL